MMDLTVMHKHRCDECGTIWMHSYLARNQLEYHKCPTCGKEEWVVYDGPEPADKVQDVKKAKPWWATDAKPKS